MSYRDLRALTEQLRALGFPRLVSLENFRQPNFPLVAEMLVWLVRRLDPGTELPTDTETEQDRVILIRSVVQAKCTNIDRENNLKILHGSI